MGSEGWLVPSPLSWGQREVVDQGPAPLEVNVSLLSMEMFAVTRCWSPAGFSCVIPFPFRYIRVKPDWRVRLVLHGCM